MLPSGTISSHHGLKFPGPEKVRKISQTHHSILQQESNGLSENHSPNGGSSQAVKLATRLLYLLAVSLSPKRRATVCAQSTTGRLRPSGASGGCAGGSTQPATTAWPSGQNRSRAFRRFSFPVICKPDALFDDDHNGHNSLAEGK